MPRRLVLVLCLLLITSPALAATYHVTTSGSDSNSCTASQSVGSARRTVAAGIACLSQGGGPHTLHIHAGTYNVPSELKVTPSGSNPGNRTIVQGDGMGQTIIRNGLYVDDVNDMWIRDLTLDGNDQVQVVSSVHSANRVRFERVEMTGAKHSAIQGSGDGHEFLGMHVHHNGVGPDSECRRPNNPDAGPGQCHGLYLEATNVLVDGGDYHDNEGSSFHYRFFCDGCTVRNVRAWNDGSACFQTSHSDNLRITNSVFWNCGLGLGGDAILFYAGSGAQIDHNTIVNTGRHGIAGNVNNPPGVNGGMTVRNNIIQGAGDQSLYGQPGTGSGNLCWNGGSTQHCNIIANPGFVSEQGGDFKIASETSQAVGAASRLGSVLTDLEGSTRNNPTALGAYEFDGTVQPPQMPPMGLVGEWKFDVDATSTAAVVVGEDPPRFHHGQLLGNSVVTSPGLVGSGKLTLNGTTAHVMIAGHADLTPATEFVIFAKIKPSTHTGRQEIYSAGDSIGFFHEAGRLACFYYNGSSWVEAKTPGPVLPPVGQTSHVACGKSQGQAGQSDGIRIYHQGAQVHFMPTTGTIAYTLGTDVFIGKHGNGGSSYFNGEVDSVRFYAGVPPTQDGVTGDFQEVVPEGGLAMVQTAWELANHAEGMLFPDGLNVPLGPRVPLPVRIRVGIELGSGAQVTEHFPLSCCKSPADCTQDANWAEVKNTFGPRGVRILNPDTAVNMGDSTQVRLPHGTMNPVMGRIVADTIDKTQKTTLNPGDHTEWAYSLEFDPATAQGASFQCRPSRENGDPFTTAGGSYANIQTITIQPFTGVTVRSGVRNMGMRH